MNVGGGDRKETDKKIQNMSNSGAMEKNKSGQDDGDAEGPVSPTVANLCIPIIKQPFLI